MQHRITIRGDGPKFTVGGDVSIQSTARPIRDAAAELIRLGAAPEDKLAVDGGPCSVSPVSLGAILKPRNLPQAKYAGAHTSSY
jgi:hypothetical protein